MKFDVSKLTNSISRNAGKISLKLTKSSPQIAMVVGTVAIVGGVFGACKATTKIDKVLDNTKSKLNDIHDAVERPEALEIEEGEYTEKDAKRDLTITYGKCAVEFAKLYALPLASIALGLGCFYGSHHIMTTRNAALAAAYASVDKSFKQYRARVVERFGDSMDKELRYDIKAQQFEKKVTDAKGKEKTVKESVEVVSDNPLDYSEYARFFDESCKEWEKDPEYNMSFLIGMQARATDLLKAKGYLFLNDVYDMLGITRTKAGQIVGWTYDRETCESKTVDENGDPVGDGFIDFGIFNTKRPNRRFVNGYEPVILLDFNVEGNVLDLL